MLTRRSMFQGLAAAVIALTVVALPVLAEELVGTIKSINADAKSFVVTPKGGGDDVEVKVDDSTIFESAKGKAHNKKFSLARVKEGGEVDVTHEKGLASKVVLKKGATKKKGE